MRKVDALRILTGLVPQIRQRFGVESLALFGSVARDEAGSSSDVDVLVGFRGTPDFDRFMDLKLFLEEHLGARVDLVTTSALRPRLRAGVEVDAINVA
jgi:hypothetical protein